MTLEPCFDDRRLHRSSAFIFAVAFSLVFTLGSLSAQPPDATARSQQEYQRLLDEERKLLERQLDPRHELAKDWLAFEEEYRGTDDAFLAIYKLMSNGGSVGDDQSAAAKARVEILSILMQHYAEHEKLESIFFSFTNGTYLEDADPFLELVLERNPHRSVRASALMTQVKIALDRLRIRRGQLLTNEQFANLQLNSTPLQRKFHLMIRSLDIDIVHEQMAARLKTVEEDYADIPHLHAGNYGNASRYTQQAIKYVGFAMPVQEIVEQDILGKTVRLSSLRGKLVVLTFCGHHANAEHLANQDIAQKCDQSNVEFITVVGVGDPKSFVDEMKSKPTVGSVIVKGNFNGALRMSWNVIAYPMTYLIDEEGKLMAEPKIGALTEAELQTFLK